VLEQRRHPASAERACRFDILAFPDRQHTGPHEPRVYRNRGDTHGDHHVGQPGTEGGDQHDGQQDAREGQHRVDDALHDQVRGSGEEARQRPDGHPDEDADGHGDETDGERDPSAVDDAAEHVAPLLVGSEKVEADRTVHAEQPQVARNKAEEPGPALTTDEEAHRVRGVPDAELAGAGAADVAHPEAELALGPAKADALHRRNVTRAERLAQRRIGR
jgi:hypothetical protein